MVYNGEWPSARLFGWSAADWPRPATNKSISSERKRKSLLFCWERKSWTSWLLTCCSKKGWAAEKSSKKGENRKEKCFLSSQTRWSWQIKRACTSFWTCSSSPGHWSHTQEPFSCHAAASTFKVCARKRNLLYIAHNLQSRSATQMSYPSFKAFTGLRILCTSPSIDHVSCKLETTSRAGELIASKHAAV